MYNFLDLIVLSLDVGGVDRTMVVIDATSGCLLTVAAEKRLAVSKQQSTECTGRVRRVDDSPLVFYANLFKHGL